MTIINIGLITPGGNALIDLNREWLIAQQSGVVPPTSAGRYRFLKDHYYNGEYIFAGEIRDMPLNWIPTADVEPLDSTSLNAFYAMGPTLGACIRTQFTTAFIYKPATYWYQSSPNVWNLSGLGAGLAPIMAHIGRIEDKST